MDGTDYGSLASALSVVLGILTYFLTVVRERAAALLEKELPPVAQTHAREMARKQIKSTLLWGSGPVAIFLALLFYLCLPTASSLARARTFALWSFDLPATLFVLVASGIGVMAVVAIATTADLINKLRKAS